MILLVTWTRPSSSRLGNSISCQKTSEGTELGFPNFAMVLLACSEIVAGDRTASVDFKLKDN